MLAITDVIVLHTDASLRTVRSMAPAYDVSAAVANL